MAGISFLRKKQLEKDIKKLDKNEYTEILAILKRNKQKYSENSKGIFFNLKYIDNKTILDIIKFVDFCKKNKEFLKKEDRNTDKHLNTDQFLNIASDKMYDLGDIDISIDIEKLLKKQNNKVNSFSFKSYLDKIAVVPKKEFKNKEINKYPDLININNEIKASNNRLLKKCKNYESIYSSIACEFDNTDKKKIFWKLS